MDTKEYQIDEALLREADRVLEDSRKIMALIDLLFLWEDERKIIPS